MEKSNSTESQVEALNSDEVTNILREIAEQVLKDATYQHNKVAQWTSEICELGTQRLTQIKKSLKYIVNCIILQKNDAGFHSATSCYWEAGADGTTAYRYENKSLYAIINVYWLSV
ncbi:uncharacterized protein VTP21DRAFT_825 [Calcarisporiella thermophila]|uniref:uncharacterized protein n=1 Tax=Calcarisporiella thermophila TaxID=911321 RepID=UPI003743E735